MGIKSKLFRSNGSKGESEGSYQVITPRTGSQRRGAKAVIAAGSATRTFSLFFGEALVKAGSATAYIAVLSCASGFYVWNVQDEPTWRHLIPGLVLGIVVVVLVYSLWLWAFRHKDAGTTLGTLIACTLFVLGLCLPIAIGFYYPMQFIGVAVAFAFSSIVLELAGTKQGQRQFEQGAAVERLKLVGITEQIGTMLSMASQLASASETSARAVAHAAETIDTSSRAVSDAAARTTAAMSRAEHIRNNLDGEVLAKANELVPDLVAAKQGEAEVAHQREIVEARQAGYHQASGEMQGQLQEINTNLTAAVGLLRRHGIIDEQGRVIQHDSAVPGSMV